MGSEIFEQNSSNPFNDPEFKKSFLKDKGLLKDELSDTEDYEVLPPIDPVDSEPGKIINPEEVLNRSSKIPASVGNIIRDLSGGASVSKLNKTQRAEAIRSSINKIFTEYNEKYGLDLKLDLSSTSNMLAELADPTTFRVYQLYLSNFMERAKALVYQKILTTILLLLDKIMEPSELLGDEMSITDRFLAAEKLINMLGVFTQFQDQIKINGADAELRKISNDSKLSDSSSEGDIRSNAKVSEFMEAMLKESGVNSNNK